MTKFKKRVQSELAGEREKLIIKISQRVRYLGGTPHPLHLATLKIYDSILIAKKVGWAATPLESDTNISWILTKNLTPALSSIELDIGGNFLSSLPHQFLNNKLMPEHLIHMEKWISVQHNVLSDADNIALSDLKTCFFLLRLLFVPHKKIKTSTNIFCEFCYREVHSSADSCYVHIGKARMLGKYHQARYQRIQKYLRLTNQIEAATKSYMMYYFKSQSIDAWSAHINIEWIRGALSQMKICAPLRIEELAKEILATSNQFSNSDKEIWPIGLTRACRDFTAYELSTRRKPSEKVIIRLNLVWKNQQSKSFKNIKKIAEELGVSYQILYRQITKWGAEIQDLRYIGIDDRVIKYIFGFSYLPN